MDKKKNRVGNAAVGALVIMLIVAAILDQLRRPPADRTWQGRVFGIPYDFRVPTIERIKAEVWNKNTAQILMPHAFGVGWGINLYPLFHPKTA